MSTDFISDAEMNGLVKSGSAVPHSPDFISDNDMLAIKAKQQPQGSVGQAALEHFGNAASLGYAPQMQAGTTKVISALSKLFGVGPDAVDEKLRSQGFKLPDEQSYVQIRDENINRLKQQEKDFPKSSAVGSVGGAIVGGLALSPILPGAAGQGMEAAVLNGIKGGSALGAIANPGDTEGVVDAFQAPQRIGGAAAGGILGGALGAAGEVIGHGAKALTNKASDLAERKAFESMGPNQRDFAKNSENVNSIGRTILDNKIVSGLPSNLSTLAQKAQEATESSGEKLGSILDNLSKDPNVGKMSKDEIGLKILDLAGSAAVPGAKAKNEQIQALVDEFVANSPKNIDLYSGNELKQAVGKEINFKRLPGADIPLTEQAQRALYTGLKDAENEIAAAAEKSGISPLAKGFIEQKQDYGNLAKAADIVSRKANREFANRDFSLTDYLSGGIGSKAGAVVAGAPGAAAGAVIGGATNKLARTYGNQAVAVASDAVSRALQRSQPLIDQVSSNPAVLPAMIEDYIHAATPIERKLQQQEQNKANRKPTAKGNN